MGPVIERAFPRTLLGLLALPDHRWRRDEIMGLLAGAPVRGADGQLVPASRWERISRAAGVVAGGDWEARLGGYAVARRLAAARELASEAPREGLIARREHDAQAADELRGFVAGLRDRVEAGAGLSSWPELAGWTTVTFRALFGDVGDEARLPEREARAADTVARVVSGLAGLGAVEPVADLTALRLTLGLELADDLPRQGSSARACWWLRWARPSGWTRTSSSRWGSPRNWCRAGCGRTRCCPSGSGRWRRGSWHRTRNHSKFIFIDHRFVLVTSANFSWTAENGHLGLGVLIDNANLAEAVEQRCAESKTSSSNESKCQVKP